MTCKSKKSFVENTGSKPSNKQRSTASSTSKPRSRPHVVCNCNSCRGRKVDPRTRELHMRKQELQIRSESSNIATTSEGTNQMNAPDDAPDDPMEIDEINISDVNSGNDDLNIEQVFSFLVKNPKTPKQKQIE